MVLAATRDLVERWRRRRKAWRRFGGDKTETNEAAFDKRGKLKFPFDRQRWEPAGRGNRISESRKINLKKKNFGGKIETEGIFPLDGGRPSCSLKISAKN